jgi:hypothetical protein
MQHLIYIISLFFILSLLLVVTKGYKDTIFSGILIFHSVLLSFIEQLLYEQGEGFYTFQYILMTSVIGKEDIS